MKKAPPKKMLIIGLTGSIGMGKSTAAKILKDFGLPVYNADAAIHSLLAEGGAGVKPVAKLFPEALKRGAIDRKIVGQAVFHDPELLKQLENILHPLVRKAERGFIAEARREKAKAVVLEIPLLFETGGEKRCDFTLCVSAPLLVQAERVLKRKNMTQAKLKAILRRQMPDEQKRKKADFIIETGQGMLTTQQQLKAVLRQYLLI